MWQETRGDPHTHCEKTCFRDAKFGGLSWLFSFVSCEDYNAISRSRRSFHRLTVIVTQESTLYVLGEVDFELL